MELRVDDLACRRGGRTVFTGLSFAVGEGEAALVRGPNGSGKSSMLRVLAGLTPAAGGSARLGDVTLSGEPEIWREQVALAGHLDAVKPVLSLRGNLETWAKLYGRPADGVMPALERFGLDHIADDPTQFCSAGQRRRLGLARLLVTGRKVWLLDEPTVSLDVDSVKVFAETVREHCAGGGIALAATHIDIGLPPGPMVVLEGRKADLADPFMEIWA